MLEGSVTKNQAGRMGHSLLVYFGLVCLFLEAGCPRTHCVFKTGLKFLTLPPPLQYWDERPANLA